MDIEFIHVNHSIADVVALAFHTSQGVVIYCSDFKFDQTPYDGKVADLGQFAELGKKGVLCLMSDSTNAEQPGYTESEKSVGETLRAAFARANGRFCGYFCIKCSPHSADSRCRSRRRQVYLVTGRSMIKVVGSRLSAWIFEHT